MTLLRFSVGRAGTLLPDFFVDGHSFVRVSEYLTAFAARQDPKLLAILRNGPARYFDVLVAQELDDALVGVGVLGVLLGDDLLDLELDGLRRQVVSVSARDPRIEEILQLV